MITARVRGESGMTRLGAKLAPLFIKGDALFLSGEMGAGKSVFARGVARALGVQEAMPSPSFTILQSYEAKFPLRHFDLYRLEDPAEFYEAGLDEQMGAEALSLVEWPEKSDFRPEPRLVVRIERAETDDGREVSFEPVGWDEGRAEALRGAISEYEREERGNE